MNLCYGANKKAITTITANDGADTRKISAVWGNVSGQKVKLWAPSSNNGQAYILASITENSNRLAIYKYNKTGFDRQQVYDNAALGDASNIIAYRIYMLPDGLHFIAGRYTNQECTNDHYQSSGLFVLNNDFSISTVLREINAGNSGYARYAGRLFFASGDLNYWFYVRETNGLYTNTIYIEKMSEAVEIGPVMFPNEYTGIRHITAYDMDNHFLCLLQKSNGNECIAIVQFPTVSAQFRVLSFIDLPADYLINEASPFSISTDGKYISVNRGGTYTSSSPFEVTNIFMLLKITNLSMSRVTISNTTAHLDIYPIRKCYAVGISNDDTKLVALITDANTGTAGTSLVQFDFVSPDEIKLNNSVKTYLYAPNDIVTLNFSPQNNSILYTDADEERVYDIPLQSIRTGQTLNPSEALFVNQAKWLKRR